MDEQPRIPWLHTALVAEDHQVAGPHIVEALQRWGSDRTRLARTTREIEEHARELGPALDVVVADLCLADGDCATLLPLIRRLAPSARLVLMTGGRTEQERLDLMSDVRPHAFLFKPFSSDELYQRLIKADSADPAADWYYELARARGLEAANRSVRELARDRAMREFAGDVRAAASGLRVSRSYMYKLLAHRGDEEEHDPPASVSPPRQR